MFCTLVYMGRLVCTTTLAECMWTANVTGTGSSVWGARRNLAGEREPVCCRDLHIHQKS